MNEKEKVSDEIKTVKVSGEFRICPDCGYERGFHLSFHQKDGSGKLRHVLICPSCGARYHVDGALR